MRIFRKREELIDAIAEEIAPDFDHKADSLECLTEEDARAIIESASQRVESYRLSLDGHVAAERRATTNDAASVPNELPSAIRHRLAVDRERRIFQ